MGLYDRNYMNSRSHQQPAQQMTGRQMMWTLIIVNVLMFFIAAPGGPLALHLSGETFEVAWLWQIFTAGFLHSGFTHIVFNMWGLYLFGSLVASHVSGKRMLILYLSGVVFGNLLFLLCSVRDGFGTLTGASGAVCAVMAAAATLEPDRRFVIIFLPFTPMKTSTLVVCYTVIEILLQLSGRDSSVAHLAHLGGFIAGYAVMRIYFGRRLPWDPLRTMAAKMRSGNAGGGTAAPPPPLREDNGSRVTQHELDELLDKLSSGGVNSLSEYELSRLRRARRQMRGEE